MMKTEVTVGIDIGGTNTAFGLVSKNGECYIKDSILTKGDRPIEYLFKRLFQKLEVLIRDSKQEFDIKGVGIGAPNGNYYTGKMEKPPNLRWGNVDLVQQVHKIKYYPTAVTNDANAAALGEMYFGAAQKKDNFILITLGTGLGSGIVVNGKMLYGHDGFAGEMGHVKAVRYGGRQCGCGRRGCLETYVSAPGVCRTAFEKLAESNLPSPLRSVKFEDLTSKKIYDAAIKGDKVALDTFQFTGELLGSMIADAVAYFSPEAVIIFGGLAKAGDLLLKPVRETYEREVMDLYQGKVQIITSGLQLDEAAILGAGALIWNEINPPADL